MVTIRDIAREAGVSLGTVSRVLSGSSATSEDSRSRVREVADRLGYVPNLQARALRGAGTGVLGLVVPDVRNPYFADLAYAAEREALRHDRVTVLANADEDADRQDRYLRALQTQRVDGMLVVPQGERSEELRRFASSGAPLVFADRRIDDLDVPSVTFDVASGMRQALVHLARQGHQRIAYVGGPLTTSTGRDRKRAFDDVGAELGLDPDPALQVLGSNRRAAGATAAAVLFGLDRPPTALVTSNGLLALGVLLAFSERGLRHGEDVELLTFDDEDWVPLVAPPLPVIAHDPELMGTTAMRLLFECADGRRPESVVLPTRLVTQR